MKVVRPTRAIDAALTAKNVLLLDELSCVVVSDILIVSLYSDDYFLLLYQFKNLSQI
jgi:hypothetical protein